MPDIKILDRHCVLQRVFGREANSPGLGHDQEGQDNGGYSRNGCRSHWSLPPKFKNLPLAKSALNHNQLNAERAPCLMIS